MNYISRLVVEVLKESGATAEYIKNKEREINGLSKPDTVAWCSGLDGENKKNLAKKLRLDPSVFRELVNMLGRL